jgi:hypothetical protein
LFEASLSYIVSSKQNRSKQSEEKKKKELNQNFQLFTIWGIRDITPMKPMKLVVHVFTPSYFKRLEDCKFKINLDKV